MKEGWVSLMITNKGVYVCDHCGLGEGDDIINLTVYRGNIGVTLHYTCTICNQSYLDFITNFQYKKMLWGVAIMKEKCYNDNDRKLTKSKITQSNEKKRHGMKR